MSESYADRCKVVHRIMGNGFTRLTMTVDVPDDEHVQACVQACYALGIDPEDREAMNAGVIKEILAYANVCVLKYVAMGAIENTATAIELEKSK